jgi:regulator of protease activity HflC (stomatin/prohibitin superfamily)
MRRKGEAEIAALVCLGFVVLFLIGGGCWAYPQYSVYQQRMAGEAELKHAESERQVQIQDAHGKLESSKMLAQAEVERAKGVAEANKIIGESLKENDAYLRYLWINRLGENGQDVIYIPTEAGLPILEAGRVPRKDH